MIRLKLKPASTEFMSIEGGEKLTSLLRRSRSLEAEGKINEACEMRLEGDLSELLQHEYDHLDGILATMRAVDNRSFVMKKR